jgi:hypothetical protein
MTVTVDTAVSILSVGDIVGAVDSNVTIDGMKEGPDVGVDVVGDADGVCVGV